MYKLRHAYAVALKALAVGVALLLTSPWASPAHTAEGKVTVLAATSTVDALEEIRTAFLKQHPDAEVELSFAASSAAAKQIVNGSPADLFISASEDWADFLDKKNLLAKRTDLLGNMLVIVVGKDSPLKLTRAEDLASAAIRKIALADPDSVPAGIYARQALEKLTLWDTVRSKYVGAANVRQAMQFVESGAADAAIVYKTDAQASKKLKVAAEIDEKLSDPIRYPLVLLKGAKQNAAAARFYDYLLSSDAEQVFRKHGFLAGSDLTRQPSK